MTLGDPDVVNLKAKPVLDHLLNQGAGFHPEYRGGLSNHLPMTLVALYGLGAHPEELLSFYNAYLPRLESLTASDTQQLGKPAGLPGTDATHLNYLSDLFSQAEQHGFHETQVSAIEQLAPGIGAAAFHGLIRTAYGIDANHLAEEFVGLAYWSQRYLTLATEQPQPGGIELETWVRRIVNAVHQQVLQGHSIEGELIHQQTAAASRTEGFTRQLDGLDIEHTSAFDFARLAARLYLASRNFTVIHLVTSAHAIELIGRNANDPVTLKHWYAVAYATALATVPPDQIGAAPATVSMLAWPDIRQRAIASMDDHVIKLCYSLQQLERLDADPVYRRAASFCVTRDRLASEP